LGIVVLLGGVVVSGITLQSTDDFAVNRPVDRVRLPVDFVCVPVLTGVRQAFLLLAVVIYDC
jgi:hypothetical protein